ncbi:hypothetical protein [Syntrophomonas palmitatica]|uniref:hypothetical protein n=1 Tax=Syntrophomonas palmitatica TaxID=402877 RepID=UPI0006D1C0F7|nr:hypothetical protein [Syntrophomonas palmitatica]
MLKISKFSQINGKADEDEVLAWVDSYFYNLMNIFSAFFAKIEVAETISRIECIPFDELVRQELEDEGEETIVLAVNRIMEMVAIEMEMMRSYLD